MLLRFYYSWASAVAESDTNIKALFSTTSIDDANVLEKTSTNSQPTQRRIANTEKFARLPVWPVWQGV